MEGNQAKKSLAKWAFTCTYNAVVIHGDRKAAWRARLKLVSCLAFRHRDYGAEMPCMIMMNGLPVVFSYQLVYVN